VDVARVEVARRILQSREAEHRTVKEFDAAYLRRDAESAGRELKMKPGIDRD
jgi:hypothetical protein